MMIIHRTTARNIGAYFHEEAGAMELRIPLNKRRAAIVRRVIQVAGGKARHFAGELATGPLSELEEIPTGECEHIAHFVKNAWDDYSAILKAFRRFEEAGLTQPFWRHSLLQEMRERIAEGELDAEWGNAVIAEHEDPETDQPHAFTETEDQTSMEIPNTASYEIKLSIFNPVELGVAAKTDHVKALFFSADDKLLDVHSISLGTVATVHGAHGACTRGLVSEEEHIDSLHNMLPEWMGENGAAYAIVFDSYGRPRWFEQRVEEGPVDDGRAAGFTVLADQEGEQL